MSSNGVITRDDTPFYVGQRILVEVEFRLLGVPTDPTIVRVFASNPTDGGTTVINFPDEFLTRIGVGLYEASVLVSAPGQWHFRVEGAGIVDSVTEIHLDVFASSIR